VLFAAGVNHPIDFTLPIIDVLPVSMLNDLNKLIILYKNDVQRSKDIPDAYTSENIDISKQIGFIEERYIYKNNFNLLAITTKNRIGQDSRNMSRHTNRFTEGFVNKTNSILNK
jgi:hypothetical protein